MDYASLYQPIPLTTGTLLALVVLFVPLLNFGWLIVLGKKSNELTGWLASGFLLGALLAAILIFKSVWWGSDIYSRTVWFEIPAQNFSYPFTIGIHINKMAALMLVVVMLISWLVHIYSIRYMEHDRGYARYFALLGLFTFSMVGVVVMDNLLLLFVFWELVGVSSYALIGFWHRRPAAMRASTKAFVMNRIGDAGFLIGLSVLWAQFGTLDLRVLEDLMHQSVFTEEGVWLSYFRANNLLVENAAPAVWLSIAGLGLLMGAVGKSAQVPLLTWLPDAMEGPTPVSALLHAATMVAAGIYLLLRVFVLLNPLTLSVAAVIGSITALVAAISALNQYDIKKVLAYSTISQLGYMMIGIGVGAPNTAFFHLVTHASFKAGLFLAAGAIIHSMSHLKDHTPQEGRFDPQDMRWMGGLRTRMPVTFAAYLVAALALAGLPLFSGFLSKDAILTGAVAWAALFSAENEAGAWHWVVPALAFATTLLTALYMGRQLLLVFFGKLNARESTGAQYHWHPPWPMRFPLILLAVLSLGIVYALNPLAGIESWILQNIRQPLLAVPGETFDYTALAITNSAWHSLATWIALGLALAGIAIAYGFYRPESQWRQAYVEHRNKSSSIARVIRQSWYLDRLYYFAIVRPALSVGRFLYGWDQRVLDGLLHGLATTGVIFAHVIAWLDRVLVDGLVRGGAGLAQGLGRLVRSVQTGRIQTHLIVSLLLFIALLYWLARV